MNILITSQHAGMAGSTYSVFYLARGLSQRGHNVYVACPSETLLSQLLSDAGLNHISLEYRSKLDRHAMRELKAIVRKYQIDIINAQASKDRYATILARWIYKLPVRLVHTRRQMPLSVSLLSWFYEKGTDKNVAVSEGVRQSLISMGISPDHIEVIYNGTPTDKYQNVDIALTTRLREKYSIQEGDFVIGCVARKKEQDQLLKAVGMLEKPVKVFLVGIERYPEYEAIISNYKTGHQVYFTGKVANHALLSYYPLFNVKVLPSMIEGLSQSLLEAMAMQVPVVATNMGGNGELIEEGKNGYLFENGDIEQLGTLLRLLMINPALQQQLGTYGKQTALNKFSIDNTVKRHEALFKKLLMSHGA